MPDVITLIDYVAMLSNILEVSDKLTDADGLHVKELAMVIAKSKVDTRLFLDGSQDKFGRDFGK